jgi:hypothetical protein
VLDEYLLTDVARTWPDGRRYTPRLEYLLDDRSWTKLLGRARSRAAEVFRKASGPWAREDGRDGVKPDAVSAPGDGGRRPREFTTAELMSLIRSAEAATAAPAPAAPAPAAAPPVAAPPVAAPLRPAPSPSPSLAGDVAALTSRLSSSMAFTHPVR